jgi:single-stranded DNA-binding protein
MNQCNFVGRMVRDAEDIKGDGVKFTVAVDVYDSETKGRKAEFIPCVAFGKVVPTIKQYAPAGKEVRVTGEYRTREYTPTQGPNAGSKVRDHSFVLNGFDAFELLAGNPKGSSGNEPSPEGW